MHYTTFISHSYITTPADVKSIVIP